MKKCRNGYNVWLLASVLLSQAVAASGQRLLTEVELMQHGVGPGSFDPGPDAPQPVQYVLKSSSGAACGLLHTGPKFHVITPILEPEPGSEWPSCGGITGSAAFKWQGNRHYVFRYLQQDTREDTYPADFFIARLPSGMRPLAEVNGKKTPVRKSIRYAAAWGKFRLVSLQNIHFGYQTSERHSVLTDTAFLNLSRNPETASCRAVLDVVREEADFPAVTWPCRSVLASTVLVREKATYFIVLTEGTDTNPAARIFVVERNQIREPHDLAQRLAPEIASGKILNIKKSLLTIAK